MTNTWCEISDKLLESNLVGKVFTKGPRCIIGFKNLQNITINGIPYKNIKGVDIKFKSKAVEVTTKTETVKVKFGDFSFVTIDDDLNFKLS